MTFNSFVKKGENEHSDKMQGLVFDDITIVPDAYKREALLRLIGAKLDSEDPPCGLDLVMGALALEETEEGISTFLPESRVFPSERPSGSKI
jgi:hypothetical protein